MSHYQEKIFPQQDTSREQKRYNENKNWICLSNRTCFQQYYCLTSIFKTQNESHPEDSKVKMKHIISFPGEKGLDFSPHLCILNNSIQPWRNVKSLRFSSDFLNFSSSSFNITPIILLRQVLILTKLCISWVFK